MRNVKTSRPTGHAPISASAIRMYLKNTWSDFVAVSQSLLGTRKSAAIGTALTYLLLNTTSAHAGIFGGALCSAYSNILDSETETVISLVSMAGAIIVWMLDDGQNKIKLWVLRVVTGVLVLFNLPVIFGTLSGHGSVC